jgi:hypothetical protein
MEATSAPAISISASQLACAYTTQQQQQQQQQKNGLSV